MFPVLNIDFYSLNGNVENGKKLSSVITSSVGQISAPGVQYYPLEGVGR